MAVSGAGTYFRIHPSDEDPETLLDPARHTTEPWGGADEGPCRKCGGDGVTEHECLSCRAGPVEADCPACRGTVRYRATCPACGGGGRVTDRSRRGVSVFPDADGLLRYMLRRDADLEGCLLVELEGERSDDVDFDADEGALLVFPRSIRGVSRLDARRVRRLRREVEV